MTKILSTIGFAMATLAAARAQGDYAGACYQGTGLPYEFRQCGREALSNYKSANPSEANSWATAALKEFQSRRNLDCDGKVKEVLIVCQNENDSDKYALVADVDIPCYRTDEDAILLQARVTASNGSPRFEELDDICNDDDDDDDDRDDDRDDDDDDK